MAGKSAGAKGIRASMKNTTPLADGAIATGPYYAKAEELVQGSPIVGDEVIVRLGGHGSSRRFKAYGAVAAVAQALAKLASGQELQSSATA